MREKNKKMPKKILSIALLITFIFQQVSYATPTYQNLATSSEIHGPQREEALRVKAAVERLELLIMDIMAAIVGGDERKNNQVAAKNAVIDLCLGNINEGEARKILTGLPFSVRVARKVSKKVITGKAEAIEAWIAKTIEMREVTGEGFTFGNREDTRPLDIALDALLAQQREIGVVKDSDLAGVGPVTFAEGEESIFRRLYNPKRDPDRMAKQAPAGKKLFVQHCFLCPNNLLPNQEGISFDDKFTIYSNPHPILRGAITVANNMHRDQSGCPIEEMAEFATRTKRYRLFYNDLGVGASIAWHHHFQGIPADIIDQLVVFATDIRTQVDQAKKGQAPNAGEVDKATLAARLLEEAGLFGGLEDNPNARQALIDFCLGTLDGEATTDKLIESGIPAVLPIEEAQTKEIKNDGIIRVSKVVDYPATAFVVENESENAPYPNLQNQAKEIIASLDRVGVRYNVMVAPGDKGPCIFIFPRSRHLPSRFNEFGVSPATIEMAGLFVVPREEVFKRLRLQEAEQILRDVSVPENELEFTFDTIRNPEEARRRWSEARLNEELSRNMTSLIQNGDAAQLFNQGNILPGTEGRLALELQSLAIILDQTGPNGRDVTRIFAREPPMVSICEGQGIDENIKQELLTGRTLLFCGVHQSASQDATSAIRYLRESRRDELIKNVQIFTNVEPPTIALLSADELESRRPRKQSATLLARTLPRGKEQRNLIGDITMEDGGVVISYSQGQKLGKTVDRFASEIVPQSSRLKELLGDGATIRIRRGLRSAAQTTPKDNVVHIPEFLANQLISGKAPIELLDKVILRNELVHRIINQHLPRSKTLEEDLAIETLATIEELKGFIGLSQRAKREIIKWIRSLKLDEKDRTRIDEFIELAGEFDSEEDLYATAGLTRVALHLTKLSNSPFEEFAELKRRRELPFLITGVLQQINDQAELPDVMREKLASVVQINAPPAEFGEFASQNVGAWDAAARTITGYDTLAASARLAIEKNLSANTLPAQELLRVRERRDARVFTNERFDFPEAQDIRGVADENIRENIGTTSIALLAGGEGVRLIGQLKRMREAEEKNLPALAEEMGMPRSNFVQFQEYCKRLRGMSQEEFDKITKPTAPLVGDKSPLQINLETIAAINEQYGVQIPVILLVSGATKGSVEEMLAKHDNFGLKNIVFTNQDTNPVVCSQEDRFLVVNNELVRAPSGTGGAVEGLAEEVTLSGGKTLGVSAVDWLEGQGCKNTTIVSGDAITPKECILGLIGADKEADGVAMGRDFPKDKNNEGVHQYKWGAFVEITDKVTGRRRLEIVEYGERKSHKGLAEAVEKVEGDEERHVSANVGLYRFSLGLIRDNIGTLRTHLSTNRDEYSAERKDGSFLKVDKIEVFLTDLLARCKRPALLRGEVTDGVAIKNPAILMEEGKRHNPVKFLTPEERRAFIPVASGNAARRVYSRLAGPFMLEDIKNSRGELVAPGLLTMIDLDLERQGLDKPAGQEHFLTLDEARNILRGMRNDPNFSAEFIERTVEDFPVYDEGQARIFRRSAWRNKVYDKLIRDKKVNLTNREIEYLFSNLSENGIGRYLLMFIRGQEKRSRTLAAAARKRKGADAEKEADAAQDAAGKYKRLWERCSKMAATLDLKGEAKVAWKDVRTTKIDARTGLELGNPNKNPFGDLAEIDFDEFHREVEGRTKSKANIWTVSGIRQIYDPTYEDLPLPRGFPWRLGIGTEPTRAAKVQACTQARLFAEVLQTWDKKGDDRFEERIPLSAMKGKTDAEKRKNLQKTKRDFSDLLAITQKGKHKTGPRKIIVFTETRSTGPALADADVRALLAAGIEVEYGGVASVTQAAVCAKENEDVDGVIYISASHNDEGYNGIKLFLGDGRVMPEAVAYPYIAVLKEKELVNPANTRKVVREVSAVSISDVREVYANVNRVKARAIKTEEEYRDRVITGISGKDGRAKKEIRKRIKAIRENNLKLRLAVIIDPNGGSREDREYFERLGFKVYELNPRPRYDMNHELCPSTGAVLRTKGDLERIRKQAQREGYALTGSIHYDTDADRRCLQPADGMGGFHLRDDMAHICFAIDVIGYVLTEKAANPDKVVGVVCNGPTSILLEELAERFGFVLLRTQTGEANVVDGMDRLEEMTFGQAQRMSKKAERGQKGSKEVFIPKSLEGKFGQNTPIKVVVAGEGSNGSDFTKALLVRDPLHTIRSMVKFMDPVEGPSLVRAYFDALGVEIDEAELAGWWDLGQDMATLIYRLIDALPASFATDFFTIGGPGMMVNPPSILGKVKDNFDIIFDEQYGLGACENLASMISDAGIPNVNAGDISYEFINYEDEAKIGKGTRKDTAPIGRKIGDGGYKVKFYVTTKDGKKHALGWIWFRDSLTEAGLTRSGASFVLPKELADLVPGLSKDAQEKLVHRAYDSLKQTLGDAVKSAVAETTKQVLVATPQTLDSSPLQDYADELREEQDGMMELARIQEDAAGYMDELMVVLEREMQSGDLCETGALEKARFANQMNRLSDTEYNSFLTNQRGIAGQRDHGQIVQLASRYIEESAQLSAKKTGEEFAFNSPKQTPSGMTVREGQFENEGRSVNVRAVTIDPGLLKLWIDPEAAGMDYDRYATPHAAAALGKEPKERPGLMMGQFVSTPPAGVEGEVLFAGCAEQFGFTCPNTFMIRNGELLTKTAPGMRQTRAQFEELKGADGSIKLKGPFDVIILNSGGVEVRRVEFDDDGVLLTDVSAITIGIAGPAIVLAGESVVNSVEYCGDGQSPLRGNQVIWDPSERVSSFSALCEDYDGNLVHLTASDLSLEAKEGRGILLADLAEIARGKYRNVILSGGSFDAQQYIAGAETVPGLELGSLIVSSGGVSATGVASGSQAHYESMGGRPLPAILYALAKPQTEVERILAAVDADESIVQRFYGDERWEFGRDHVMRVTRLALLIARDMGLPEEDQLSLVRAAFLHDAGFMTVAALTKWNELGHKYGFYRPRREFLNDAQAFMEKYDCPQSPLGELKRQHADDELALKAAVVENIPAIVSAKLRHVCDTEELGELAPAGRLEETLEEAFNHGRVGAEKVMSASRQDLANLGISQEFFNELFLLIEFHLYPSRMPSDTSPRIRRLAHILTLADTVEAGSNRRRAREGFYKRTKETLKDLFYSMRMKRDHGDVSPEAYAAAEGLILGQNPEMVSLICQAREIDALPGYDQQHIAKAKPEGVRPREQSAKDASAAVSVEPLLNIVAQPAGEDPGNLRSRIINALSNRHVVTFATHPDDVEINEGGLFALLPTETKSQMYWGILTTGAGRTADGVAIGVDDIEVEDDARKVSTREDEARAGAQTLGIMPGNVSFFGFGAGDTRVDGDNLSATMGEEQCRQVVEYLKKLSVDLPPTEPLVVCIQDPRADKHPAHDHSYRFLRDGINRYMAETKRSVTLLEYGLDSDAEETNLVVPLIAREVTAKVKAVKKHRTQINRQKRKKEQQPDSLTAEEFARNLSRASDEERKRYGNEFVERYKCEVLTPGGAATAFAKKKGDVEHKTGTPKDVNKAVASATAVKFLSGRRQVKVDASERTYTDERSREEEYIDAARTTLKNLFIGYEAGGERKQDTIDRFGPEFLKAVEAFIRGDINLAGVTPRDGSPFIYFGDENNHQSLHVGINREIIYIGQGLYDQIKSKEGSMLAAAVAHDLGRFAGLSDDKVEGAERHIVGRSQRGDKGSKLDDRIDEIAERYAASRLEPEEIFTSIAKWVTAEDALAQAREWAGPGKRVMISYPSDRPLPQASDGTSPPGRGQAYETAVLVDIDNARPLHDSSKSARWTLLENREGNAITLVAESLRTPDPSTDRHSTPHALHDFIANNAYRHVTKDGLSFTIEGNANRTYVSESRQFLQRFLAEVKTQGKPVLLRIPIEALIGLTAEERKSWLLALNEAENVFVEIYTMRPGKTVLGAAYTTLGLGALYEKNQKLAASGFASSRENTITLLVATKEERSATFKGAIEGNEILQNSVIVPIAKAQRGDEPGEGDAAGLIRGSLFGFRLIDIARDQQNMALIDEARQSYQNLMMMQGATDLRIGRQDIRNLLSSDSGKRAAALRKIAASLPEETAVSIEERLEIFRQAEILARSA